MEPAFIPDEFKDVLPAKSSRAFLISMASML